MKHIKTGVTALLLIGMVIALTSIVCADQGVPAVPETQGLVTGTTADVIGLATETDAGTWTLSNMSINPMYTDPMLSTGQVQYTTAYDADIVSQAGHTVLTKSMNLDTRNKVLGQSNLNAQTGITYIATADGGNVVGSENLMLDGAGNVTNASDRMLCPFAASIASVIPASCNIVQSGSTFDLTVGSVTTTANDKFVSNDASLPVTLNYNINVKPYGTTQGQIPAGGSTSAYIKAHIQEARGANVSKAEDLTYSETSSATGRITAFNKLMSYSSQVTSTAVVNHVIHASVGGELGVFTSDHVTAYISPMGDIQVPDHTSITFYMGTTGTQSIQVSPGVAPVPPGSAAVSVDGGTPVSMNSYTFQDVTSDHTIVAHPEGT